MSQLCKGDRKSRYSTRLLYLHSILPFSELKTIIFVGCKTITNGKAVLKDDILFSKSSSSVQYIAALR